MQFWYFGDVNHKRDVLCFIIYYYNGLLICIRNNKKKLYTCIPHYMPRFKRFWVSLRCIFFHKNATQFICLKILTREETTYCWPFEKQFILRSISVAQIIGTGYLWMKNWNMKLLQMRDMRNFAIGWDRLL